MITWLIMPLKGIIYRPTGNSSNRPSYKAVKKRYRIAKCDEKTLPVRDNLFLV